LQKQTILRQSEAAENLSSSKAEDKKKAKQSGEWIVFKASYLHVPEMQLHLLSCYWQQNVG
jgi:hypothetical protein